MALSAHELIQVLDVQTYQGQTLLNVYYYRCTDIAGATSSYLSDFLTQFIGDVITVVKGNQASALLHTVAEARNLSNGVDVASMNVNISGGLNTGAGTYLPPFVCYTFRLQRASLVTRHGYKRFAGVTESLAEEDGTLTSAADTWITNVRAALQTTLTDANDADYIPVILNRAAGVVGTAYTYSEILDVDFRGLGTQNTRKIGRGS